MRLHLAVWFLWATLPLSAQEIDIVVGSHWKSLTIAGPGGPVRTFDRNAQPVDSGPWHVDVRNGQFRISSSSLPRGDYYLLYSWKDDGSGEEGACGVRIKLQAGPRTLLDASRWQGSIAVRAEGPPGGEVFLRRLTDGPGEPVAINWLRVRSTSANGIARFSELPWGRYVTDARETDGCRTSQDRNGLTLVQLPFRTVDNAIQIDGAAPHRVLSDRSIVFAPVGQTRTYQVRVTAGGRAVKGYRVRFVRDDPILSNDSFPFCGQVSTKANGLASFVAPAGDYLVAVLDAESGEALKVALLKRASTGTAALDVSRRSIALTFRLTSSLSRGVDPARTAVPAQFIPENSGLDLPGTEANRRQRTNLDTIGILTLPGSKGIAPMTTPLKTTLVPGTYRVVIQLIPRNSVLEPRTKGLGLPTSSMTAITRVVRVTIAPNSSSMVVLVP